MQEENNRIIRINDHVFHIYESLGVYCTLIVGSKAALLIDTGFGFGDIVNVVRNITNLPIKVINTHGHVDHIQGNKFFDQVMICKPDKGILRFYSSLLVKLFIYLGARKVLTTDEKDNTHKFFQMNRQHAIYVKESDIIDIGNITFEVIETPGHTKGSICILDKEDKILFAGDSISSHVWLFLKESTKIDKYRESVLKLKNLPNKFNIIVSSHSAAEFRPSILDKILHCTESLNVEQSTYYDSHLAGKALLYSEGFERIQQKYGYETFEEFQRHALEINPKDIADIEFVSIAYSKDKLK